MVSITVNVQFLILDLHKSEVGPSNIYLFFSIFFFFFSIVLPLMFFVSLVSRFSLPQVLETSTTS